MANFLLVVILALQLLFAVVAMHLPWELALAVMGITYLIWKVGE